MRLTILAILSILTVGCTPESPESTSAPASESALAPAPESGSLRNQPSRKTDDASDVRAIDQLTARVVEALRAKDVAALKRIGDEDFDAETSVRRWHNKLGEGLSKPIDHQFHGKRYVHANYFLLQSPHGLSVGYNRIDGEWKLRSVAVMGW